MKQCLETIQPRWTRRKQERPQELLEAALTIFSEKGFTAARLEDVAKSAGVSKGTVYLYYSNKEELLKAVVKEHVSPIVEEAKRLQEPGKSSATLIREAIHLWWLKYGSTKLSAITKIVLSEANAFPDLARFFYDEVVKPWWDYLESILKRGVARGEFTDIDTEYAAKVLCAPLVTLGIWKRTMDVCCGLETNPLRYIEAHIQMVLNGLTCPQHQAS
ncbi:MAG TPA: TetR/AcrR family transcriptional regulator [Limnobacter sp.]|nr:TetR/AcrR family transcriptional regulator [Limnobacter sp.]